MKILITGATGFIGHHLVSHLLAKGHSVTATMRRAGMASADSKRRLAKLEKLEGVIQGRFKLLRSEDFESIYTALQKIRPDVCIHLAGRSWVRESIGYPDLYEDANYRYTVGLAEALRLCSCNRLIFASTVMVYGNDAPLPYMEDALGSAPASPYGASKLASEVLINSYNRLHGMKTINLRLFSAYGPDIRPDTVPYLIASAIIKGKPFTIYGDGSSVRDYIEIEDVLRAFDAALNSNESYPALNIGSGFGTSLLELIDLTERWLGKKAEIIYKPAIPGELATAVPDLSLAMEKLNWEPIVPIEEGIHRLVDWFKSPECPPLK